MNRSAIRGVRTRGGALVPATPARNGMRGRTGRSAGRRGGGRSPRVDAVDMIPISNIENLPRGTRHETPLHIKKRRLWSPEYDSAPALKSASSQSPSSIGANAPSPDPLSIGANAPSSAPSSTGANSPFPAVLIKCEETSPQRSPKLQRRTPRARRRLGKDEICFLNYGSEESCSDGEDDLLPVQIPRVYRETLDTPLDPIPDASPEWPAASAEQPAASPEALATGEPAALSDGAMLPVDPFDFVWTDFPDPAIPSRQRREPFSPVQVGPTAPCDDGYKIFTTIWDHDIMQRIVDETNRYAQERTLLLMEGGHLGPYSRLSNWVDTNIDEVYSFMAIVMAMGIVIKTKIEDYWSNNQDIFTTPGFRAHMKLKRFELLCTCLHFNSNSECQVNNITQEEAKLHKIEPIITHLNSKFQSMYALDQNIALDESLLQWKGWLSINQFIANKTAKIGIKTYEVCESQSGYLWRFEVHAHSSHTQELQSPLDGFIPTLVLRLVDGLEGKGHTIWMDNFYNSPALARRLKSTGFDVVGTLRTNRQFVPRRINDLTKSVMTPGQITGCTSGDVDVMVWMDENRVATISTYHGNEVQRIDGKIKPCLVHDYNIMMGGVDKKDQMLAMFPIERKRTRIWYKKFFRRLLNVSVLNSFIIARKSSLRKLDHRKFRMELITTILSKHCKAADIKESLPDTMFLAKDHYLMEQPLGSNKSRLRRKCVTCSKLTHFYCIRCEKSACIGACFAAMH